MRRSGKGFFVYGNGTIGSAKYADTQLWVASSPHDTETIGLTYLHGTGISASSTSASARCTTTTAALNQAVAIDPFNITNLFLNYTVKQASFLRGTKFRVGINNLFDQHNIVGVSPASKTVPCPRPATS